MAKAIKKKNTPKNKDAANNKQTVKGTYLEVMKDALKEAEDIKEKETFPALTKKQSDK